MIGFRKEGGFGKELAASCRMKDHEMIIDRAADQPNPAAFDLVYRRRLIALSEQRLARRKIADDTSVLKQGW